MMLIAQDGKRIINLDNMLKMDIVTYRKRLVSDDDYVRTRPELREKITSKIRCFMPKECIEIATYNSEDKAVEELSHIINSIGCELSIHQVC